MKVTYCDRCGRIIDKVNRDPYQNIIPSTKYIILKSNPINHEIDTTIDICPECQGELDKWLKECKSKED